MRVGMILAALLATAAQAQSAGLRVRVEGGLIEGIPAAPGSAVQSFRGVPFAAPPVGPLRWREPQPVPRWTGVRAATQFGARCMQLPLFPDMAFRSPGMSEDCLTLNVWTPADLKRHAHLPVLVYVYGGGFQAGDASERRYDGAYLAAHGIVVVTVNYRLGAFGFMALPELTAESPRHASGNYGLLDQAAALAWVKRNIAAFGGDPARITIGGESAGSMSVSGLMASPLTRGLIAGAIGESGALMGMLAPMPREAAEQQGRRFAQTLGVATLADLRAVPADRLLAAQGGTKDFHFSPDVDGYFLPEPPTVTFAEGRAAHVPLLAGTNSQEASYQGLFRADPPILANYKAALVRQFGAKADQVADAYPVTQEADVIPVASDLASDQWIAWPTWKWFDLQRRSGAPSYYYQYRRVRPRALADTSGALSQWGATHSAEIEYAFGDLDVNPAYGWTDEDRRVSATMSGYWINFVKSGNPNGAGLPDWPRASSDAATVRRQLIDVDTHSAPLPQARYVAMEPVLGGR
jgi:para-nitrobenzyl esterase